MDKDNKGFIATVSEAKSSILQIIFIAGFVGLGINLISSSIGFIIKGNSETRLSVLFILLFCPLLIYIFLKILDRVNWSAKWLVTLVIVIMILLNIFLFNGYFRSSLIPADFSLGIILLEFIFIYSIFIYLKRYKRKVKIQSFFFFTDKSTYELEEIPNYKFSIQLHTKLKNVIKKLSTEETRFTDYLQ